MQNGLASWFAGRAMLLACGVAVFSTPLLAHHGTFASYNRDKTITMKGTVTEFQFAYPHPLIFFDVPDENGKVVHWAAEMLESPGMLKKKDARWNREYIKPNDQLLIVCNPHKVATAKVCRAQELTVNERRIY
jgi:Family of unknown function (DUF6152)